MGENSKIEWTDATWNPIRARNLAAGKIGWHCEHVSEGCRNCYAESMNRRLGTGLDFKPGHRPDVEIFLDEKMLLAPLRWKTPRRIFVNSMSDTFAEFVKDEWLDRMFAVIALCHQHTFQVLTKRPERMRAYMDYYDREAKWMGAVADLFEIEQKLMNRCYPIMGQREPWLPLPNVWLGVSAEDQATADERIPLLLQTPAAVRFVSLEPLLGPIRVDMIRARGWALTQHMNALTGAANPSLRGLAPEARLDWVIAGGESGPHARASHLQWFRSLRDQCASAGAPFFFKQWGEWRPRANDYPRDADRAGIIYPDGHFVRRGLGDATGEGGADMFMAGKKAAGRLLDGRTHNGMPPAHRETAQSATKDAEPS